MRRTIITERISFVTDVLYLSAEYLLGVTVLRNSCYCCSSVVVAFTPPSTRFHFQTSTLDSENILLAGLL